MLWRNNAESGYTRIHTGSFGNGSATDAKTVSATAIVVSVEAFTAASAKTLIPTTEQCFVDCTREAF